jgi:hypothetical protein
MNDCSLSNVYVLIDHVLRYVCTKWWFERPAKIVIEKEHIDFENVQIFQGFNGIRRFVVDTNDSAIEFIDKPIRPISSSTMKIRAILGI